MITAMPTTTNTDPVSGADPPRVSKGQETIEDAMPRAADNPPAACQLTTFYNGACPVCRTEIEHYRAYAGKRGLPLGWRDISRDAAELAGHGLTAEDVKRRMYTLDADGNLLGGVDAFIAIWSLMPRYRWLAWLARRPGLRQLADFLYERLLAPSLYRWHKGRERRGKA